MSPTFDDAVTASGATTGHAKTLIDDFLTYLFALFQKIEVRDERGIPNAAGSLIAFQYQNWNTSDFAAQMRRNGTTLLTLTTDYEINATTGKVSLITPLTIANGDFLNGTYAFKYFSDNEWESYLEWTLRELNGRKPISAYELDDAPTEWDAVLILGAYIKSIRKLYMDMNIWRTWLIFPNQTTAQATLGTLLSTAEAEYQALVRKFKPRSLVKPRGVQSGKYYTPILISSVNWQNYTIIGTNA